VPSQCSCGLFCIGKPGAHRNTRALTCGPHAKSAWPAEAYHERARPHLHGTVYLHKPFGVLRQDRNLLGDRHHHWRHLLRPSGRVSHGVPAVVDKYGRQERPGNSPRQAHRKIPTRSRPRNHAGISVPSAPSLHRSPRRSGSLQRRPRQTLPTGRRLNSTAPEPAATILPGGTGPPYPSPTGPARSRSVRNCDRDICDRLFSRMGRCRLLN
jgi:hypothetical protein